jgi:hypothetical protein
MHLVLVDNLLYERTEGRPNYRLQPHLGLISLAAVALQGGHAVDIYDPKWDLSRGWLCLDDSLYPAMAERIAAYSPDVVGFTALGCNFHGVVRIASHLKRLQPDLPILLGGPHASILHQKILERFDVFDVVARHEAENTLLPMLEWLGTSALENVSGISYRSLRGQVRCNPAAPMIDDLDQLPFPAYDCYPIEQLGIEHIHVEAGRGCPFSCTFCSTATFFGRKFRLKSPQCLVTTMDRLNTRYGFTAFGLQHDLFTVNRKKILTFCDAVRNRRYRWSCSARVDCVDEELLRAMAAAGCKDIYFGIETGSPRMQAISRKHLHIGLVEPTLSLTRSLGMMPTVSFITGYPEEDSSDQAATLDLAGRFRVPPHTIANVQLHLLTPEPGTELIERYGHSLGFDGHVSDFNFPMLDPADTLLLKTNPDLFVNHHFFPTVVERERHIFVTTAWHALAGLSRHALRYLLTAFDGRLSRLFDDLDAWRRSQGMAPAAIDASLFTTFIAARFGKRHHLVSLCRYASARFDRLDHTGNKPEGSSIEPSEARFVLSRQVEVIADIHRLKKLATILSQEPAAVVPDRRAGSLVCLIVMAQGASFEIDHAMMTLLERLRHPKTYPQLHREMIAAGDRNIPDRSELLELCREGMLECVPATPIASAGLAVTTAPDRHRSLDCTFAVEFDDHDVRIPCSPMQKTLRDSGNV